MVRENIVSTAAVKTIALYATDVHIIEERTVAKTATIAHAKLTAVCTKAIGSLRNGH